jgi:dynein heavy chain
MRSAPDVTNVVEACNLDGRQERLDNMLAQLETCEKALQVRAAAKHKASLARIT